MFRILVKRDFLESGSIIISFDFLLLQSCVDSVVNTDEKLKKGKSRITRQVGEIKKLLCL